MRVYVVTKSSCGNGYDTVSVWTTKEAAEREAAKLEASDRDYYYDVDEMEVRE